MKIVRQLAKEFLGPLVGSTVWVIANFEGDLKGSATLFGGTFFFLSWLSGQFFRVKKQSATEESLTNIRSDIAALLRDLKIRTNDLLGNVTGGMSFCHVVLGFDDKGYCDAGVIVHYGDFALHDINVRVCNLDVLDDAAKDGILSVDRAFTNLPSTQILLPNQVQIFRTAMSIGKSDTYRFNIFVQARNGGLVQQTRGVRINGLWLSATRISRQNEAVPCFEKIDELYPRTDTGTVNWE